MKKFLGSVKRYILNQIDNPGIILLYHRVTNLPDDPQLLSVRPDYFYDQVSFLKKNFSLTGIEEFSDCMTKGKKIPRKSVILTFDDGYADNYYEALPILESLNAQALFYITTSNLNTMYELWWDELERILLSDHLLPGYIEVSNDGKIVRLRTSSAGERLTSYHFLRSCCKNATPADRKKLIDELRASAGISTQGRKSHRLMTTKELKCLSDSPAAVIGAHTLNHPALSMLSYAQQKEEIIQSKVFLENLLEYPIQHFSYPYGGKKDYDKNSIHICHETGFKMVCSNYYGHVHSWTNCFELPRVLIRDWNKQTFSQYMTKTLKY